MPQLVNVQNACSDRDGLCVVILGFTTTIALVDSMFRPPVIDLYAITLFVSWVLLWGVGFLFIRFAVLFVGRLLR